LGDDIVAEFDLIVEKSKIKLIGERTFTPPRRGKNKTKNRRGGGFLSK